jgi:hypothetical protein
VSNRIASKSTVLWLGLAPLLLAAYPSPASAGAVGQGTTTVVVATDDPVPDGNGEFQGFYLGPEDTGLSSHGGPILNDAGHLTFSAYLKNTSGGSSDDSGLFLWDGSAITQLVREGQSPPDGDGDFYQFHDFASAALNDANQVAYDSHLIDSASGLLFESAVYFGDGSPGNRVSLARTGRPAPGGDVFQDASNPIINASGQTAFIGGLESSDPLGDRALYRAADPSGQLTRIVRQFDPTPDGTASFRLIGDVTLNDAGQVAFLSSLYSQAFDDHGVFRGDGSALTQIARKGQPIPGSATESISNFGGSVTNDMNEAGQVVVWADFTDSGGQQAATGQGYLLGDGSDLELVVRSGQPAPDGNGVFANFENPLTLTATPDLNDSGQIAFFATLAGATGGADLGYFRSAGPGGPITQIARSNDPAPDGNGVFGLTFVEQDGAKRNGDAWMNDAGQVAFFTNLSLTRGGSTDDTGIYFYDDRLGLLQVARTGDALLGARITRVALMDRQGLPAQNDRSGLNDRGQVAYTFVLDDGREGIALWNPPVQTIFADGFESGDTSAWSAVAP